MRWVADLVGYPADGGRQHRVRRQHRHPGGDRDRARRARPQGRRLRLRGGLPDHAGASLHREGAPHRRPGRGAGPLRRRWTSASACGPTRWQQAIAADRAPGLRPWLVIAAAGTTDTGAVDPLDAIATIAERERCWFHVDAAYGGFFLLTEHGRRLLEGIERSDSVVLDPHKGLFLPYGAGIVVVRDAGSSPPRTATPAHYMQDAVREPGEISPADVSPELSKHFRALRMWLPLILLGTRPFQAALEEKLLLARYFHREIAALGFEVGPAARALDRDLSLGAAGSRAGARPTRINQAIVDGVRRDGAGVPLLHHARRPVHAADGRAGVPDPPADDRSGAPGAPRAGGRGRRLAHLSRPVPTDRGRPILR